ncbi:MAG: winged helix-turn-helix transcriptional regulator [Bacteroidota bacterium]
MKSNNSIPVPAALIADSAIDATDLRLYCRIALICGDNCDMSNEDIATMCGLSVRTTKRSISRLVDGGYLVRIGSGRSRVLSRVRLPQEETSPPAEVQKSQSVKPEHLQSGEKCARGADANRSFSTPEEVVRTDLGARRGGSGVRDYRLTAAFSKCQQYFKAQPSDIDKICQEAGVRWLASDRDRLGKEIKKWLRYNANDSQLMIEPSSRFWMGRSNLVNWLSNVRQDRKQQLPQEPVTRLSNPADWSTDEAEFIQKLAASGNKWQA